MQLVSLKVIKNNSLVREVFFKSGINIITNSGVNGNQIGKSTTLRAINFCLGSDYKNLWKDPDQNIDNLTVKDFILNGNVVFELKIKGTINHVLKRSIYQQAQKNRVIIKTDGWIDDTHVSSVSAYKKLIAKNIFNYDQEVPTFNTIRTKFTRVNRLTSNNSLKYLDVHTKDADYTIIYSALFGFAGINYLKKELGLIGDIEKKTKRIDALLDGRDIIDISDSINDIDLQIEHYNSEEDEIDLTTVQSKVIDQLRELRRRVASISTEVAALETRLIYNSRTIERYKDNLVEIDVEKVSAIYAEAVGFIPSVSKTLQETIDFHNAIFAEKAQQSEKRNKVIIEELSVYKEILVDLIEKEKRVIKKLSGDGQLKGLILVEREIQSLSEERGKLAYVFEEVKILNRDVRLLSIELQKVKDKVELLISGLKGNVNEFNSFFSKLTRKLFKKHANLLNVDVDGNNNVRFTIVNADKNTGDGTPRAEAMAFDMALVEYLKGVRKNMFGFTLQDYLESVDEEKIFTLFTYAEKNELQVIVSILNDKLKLLHSDFLEKNTILRLSSDNKFFNI